MARKHIISTKTGDNGSTSIKGGRISKGSLKVDVYGTIDEILALIGFNHYYLKNNPFYCEQLETIMLDLKIIIKEIACQELQEILVKKQLLNLEALIDTNKANLKEYELFGLVIGDLDYLHLNLTRTKVRELERKIVTLNELEEVNQISLAYLNRLSDYFFVLSKLAQQKKL